jgi:galactokinase
MNLTALMQAVAHRDAALHERLRAAYGADDALITTAWARLDAVLRRYADAFGVDADVVVTRAPGRVNLIGEHTDYNGLPVMPMAISRDVLIVAGARSDPEVHAVNVDRSFGDRHFAIERTIAPFAAGDWGNYIKSALQGLIEF